LTQKIYIKLNRSNQRSINNATIEDLTCAQSASNRMDILRNCPMLKFEDDHYVLTQKITVAIKRHQTIIDALFTAVVMFLVTAGTLCIGCGLEMEQLTNNFRRPVPLLIGFFCQIVFLPLLSFSITKIFRLDPSTSLGLISTASSPGKIFELFCSSRVPDQTTLQHLPPLMIPSY
jgi:hypothetical protein